MEDDSFLRCPLGGYFKMKLIISFLVTSCQKLTEVDNEGKLCNLCKKFMVTEVAADALGKEWLIPSKYVDRNNSQFPHE